MFSRKADTPAASISRQMASSALLGPNVVVIWYSIIYNYTHTPNPAESGPIEDQRLRLLPLEILNARD